MNKLVIFYSKHCILISDSSIIIHLLKQYICFSKRIIYLKLESDMFYFILLVGHWVSDKIFGLWNEKLTNEAQHTSTTETKQVNVMRHKDREGRGGDVMLQWWVTQCIESYRSTVFLVPSPWTPITSSDCRTSKDISSSAFSSPPSSSSPIWQL